MKMDFKAYIVAFTMLWKLSSSLRCYKCGPENEPRCEHFDYSDKYQIDCDSSNMCFKKETSHDYGNGLTTMGIERGCAPQTIKGYQEKKGHKWVQVNKIFDEYRETCEEIPNDGERITKTLHCYCRGDFCNGARRISTSYIALLVTVLTLGVIS